MRRNPTSTRSRVDRAYLAKAPTPGLYAMYYGHNLHFLAFAAMMSGNYEQAIQAARDLEAEMPESALRDLRWASSRASCPPTSTC